MTRPRDWVRALAGGRRRVIGRWDGASMVLALRPVARPRPAQCSCLTIHHHHRPQRHVHRHGRLLAVAAAARATTTRAQPQRAARSAHATVVTAGPAGQTRPVDGSMAIPPPRAQPAPPPAAGRAMRRVIAQIAGAHRRVERMPAPGATVRPISKEREATRSAAALPAPPVGAPAAARSPAMVMRPAAVAAPAAALATAPAELPGRTLGTPSTPAAASDLDLESLADRVVQHIDRRVVAHRERLGQI